AGALVCVSASTSSRPSGAHPLASGLGKPAGKGGNEATWKGKNRTSGRSKNTDTFKPMGPWIETDVDLDAMHTNVRLNGEVRTSFRTNDMLFGIAHFIATMTRYLTLHPGDMIWMGTDGSSPNIKSGDLVEVEITGIGTLRNRFVREGAA